METWPSRNWIWSSSPPAKWHKRAQVRRRSCGASRSMPARAAAARTTSQRIFGDMPSPHTRPALLIARKTAPPVMSAAAIHASMAAFTHLGMGTVRTCPLLPTRSAITQCSSRCWIDSTRSVNNSARRSPQPIQHGDHCIVTQLTRCRERRVLKQPAALLACQPIAQPNADPPYAFHATNARREFRTQESDIGGLVRDTADRGESQVDGRGRIAALLQVDPIAEDHGAVGCQPRLRTVRGVDISAGLVGG